MVSEEKLNARIIYGPSITLKNLFKHHFKYEKYVVLQKWKTDFYRYKKIFIRSVAANQTSVICEKI